jgi:signal transduction histidine kinase
MAQFQSPPPSDALAWVFLAGIVYVLGTTFLPLMRMPDERLSVIFSVIDIGLITALIYSTGGVHSEYYLLYYLPILNAAVRLNFRDAVGASALAAACYVFAVAAAAAEGESNPHLFPRAFTFSASSILLAGFFAYLCHESRTYQQLSQWYRQANEEKAQFVSAASHELRTPLTAIMGFSDLLCSSEVEPERQQEYLSIIKSQAERLARLIENILEMSRVDAGRIKLQPVAVHLREALSRTLEKVSGANGNVAVSLPDDLPPACADMKRVEQILRIFLENAISFCPENLVEVSAWIEAEAMGRQGEICIQVKDHGPGIPTEDLPHIFDMFYCASNSAGRQGTGLSLAIAKRMAELQGGEVWAESIPGDGAIFGLRLPLWEEEYTKSAAEGDREGKKVPVAAGL